MIVNIDDFLSTPEYFKIKKFDESFCAAQLLQLKLKDLVKILTKNDDDGRRYN